MNKEFREYFNVSTDNVAKAGKEILGRGDKHTFAKLELYTFIMNMNPVDSVVQAMLLSEILGTKLESPYAVVGYYANAVDKKNFIGLANAITIIKSVEENTKNKTGSLDGESLVSELRKKIDTL